MAINLATMMAAAVNKTALNPMDVADIGGAVPDFSVIGMFMQADWIVKSVIIMLLFASVVCWAIIYNKSKKIRRITKQAEYFEGEFWSGNSLEALYDRVEKNPDHPMALIFVSAMREWRRSIAGGAVKNALGVKDRIHRVMRVTVTREMDELEKYLSFLATVGSTAPFVGLFGTVWGIMGAFQDIAITHDSSLAVVAPGIAEALFATAMGLVAAIPAVVAYNKITNEMGRYANRIDTFSDEFGTILSRQLDEEHS
jgi:biopolymer transport protein TolQ